MHKKWHVPWRCNLTMHACTGASSFSRHCLSASAALNSRARLLLRWVSRRKLLPKSCSGRFGAARLFFSSSVSESSALLTQCQPGIATRDCKWRRQYQLRMLRMRCVLSRCHSLLMGAVLVSTVHSVPSWVWLPARRVEKS